ncbi:hypothetical protein [Acinetobacter venetianus]|uniref:hypothetical protein n=1 Tax=Acinetobacter venetianus TaxID=52133 RepID=UPI003F925FF9
MTNARSLVFIYQKYSDIIYEINILKEKMLSFILIVLVLIFAYRSLVIWYNIIFSVTITPLSKKLTRLFITIIVTSLVFIYSAAYTLKRNISERVDTFEVFERYYPPKNCMNKIQVNPEELDGFTDSDVEGEYIRQFYESCVFSPDVTCRFNNDIIFNSQEPDFDCGKTTVQHLQPSNAELINTFPLNFLYNLY